jgi:hypothetical protein
VTSEPDHLAKVRVKKPRSGRLKSQRPITATWLGAKCGPTAPRKWSLSRPTFGKVQRRASGRYFLDWAWHDAPITFVSNADTSAWLARDHADRSRGVWGESQPGKEPLEAYANSVAGPKCDRREATRARYGDLLRRHILPVSGRKELANRDLD